MEEERARQEAAVKKVTEKEEESTSQDATMSENVGTSESENKKDDLMPAHLATSKECLVLGFENYVIHIGESNEARSKKSRGVAEGERRALCYVQDNGSRKKKKMEAEIHRRLWDPGIKIVFRQHLEDKVVSEGVGSVTTAKSRITIK
ncbi:hypothetical protein Tco_0989680 [Tanacetum coccineum]|uniref:Uncharacterized protein n=1 Tax=Tanacetum coccineum TaxID=301880 RepID=A0ABQ5EUC3_9ASTR